MIHLFTPDEYLKNFTYVDVEKIKKKDKKLIICDIDNTLVAHDESMPSKEAKAFVKRVQDSGLDICLISNNHKDRVQVFAEDLGLPFYSFAKKPLKLTYRKILKDYKMKAKDIVAIGDQMLTDVFGAKRMRIYCILTNPLVERDLNSTKFNRKIENQVFRVLERKKILKKGEFNE